MSVIHLFYLLQLEVNCKDCNCAIKNELTAVQKFHPAISITAERLGKCISD